MNRKTHLALSAAIASTLGGFPKFHFSPEGIGAPAPGSDTFSALRSEFAKLQGEADAVLKAAETDSRDLTDAEKAENEKRFSRMQAIKSITDERLKFASLALSDAPPERVKAETPKTPPGADQFARETDTAGADLFDFTNAQTLGQFSRSVTDWARSGSMAAKFATITTASQSSILLPRVVSTPDVPTAMNTFREALALYGISPVKTSTTSDWNQPVVAAAAGAAVAENASIETANDPGLTGSYTLNVATYQSGSAWFSNKALLANDFDLVPFIQTDLAYAKDLGFESAIAAAMIADTGITQAVTSSTTTAFTYGNLVSLNNALGKVYQRQKVILLGAAAYSAAEGLVDSTGQPILVRDPQNQSLLRFNGTPVLRCDYLEALTANKVIGLIISLAGFRLRDVTTEQLSRYVDQPAKPGQSGFNLIGWHGYGYTAAAVAKLKTAVS